HAWNRDEAPVLARTRLSNANPTGTVFVALPGAIPKELHFNPAILVGPNLFSGLTDDDGGLGALDHRLAGPPRRPECPPIGNSLEGVVILARTRLAGTITGILP